MVQGKLKGKQPDTRLTGRGHSHGNPGHGGHYRKGMDHSPAQIHDTIATPGHVRREQPDDDMPGLI